MARNPRFLKEFGDDYAKYIEATRLDANNKSTNKDLSFDEESSDIKRLIRSNAIYDKYRMGLNRKFTRFPIIDPYNQLNRTKEYIFATKPDLWIFNGDGSLNPSLANNPFFVDATNRYHEVALQLQSSASEGNVTPFIPIISNSVTSSLDIPGISADTIETAANINGTKISYRSTSHKSDEDFDFTLEFEDTAYLDVYMLFKMYDQYEKLKWEGEIDFTKEGSQRWQNYIVNKVLHDQFSFYKFVVAEDGMRIVYFANYTGCMVTSVPRDAFSDMSDTVSQKITVGFRAHFVRDMDPIIIRQFNIITSQTQLSAYRDQLPLFDDSIHAMNGSWASMPYVEKKDIVDHRHGSHREYYLRWKE